MPARWLRLILALLIVLSGSVLPARAASQWDPKQTYALLVGCLEWQAKELAKFPKKGRLDRVLEKTLQDDGVPAEQIVFLEDRQATGQAMRQALQSLVRKAGPGSTLLVYYAGHGLQDKSGTYFANYDVDPDKPAQTGFAMRELGQMLEGWRGERVVFLSDCCHSGALMEPVRYLGQRGRKAACITSATDTNTSTGRWTYTQALIDAFEGDGLVDLDRNGTVTFAEADRHVSEQMQYGEDQLTHAVTAGGFETDLALRRSRYILPGLSVGAQWAPGSYLEGLDQNGVWYRAQILSFAKGSYKVHFIGWEDKWDEWLTPDKLRPITLTDWPVGAHVEVEWEGQWYPARILKSEGRFFYFVHYDDYGSEWDEWVTAKRLRR